MINFKKINFSLEFFLNNYNIKNLINFKKFFILNPKFITITYNNLKINKKLINFFINRSITIIPHLICKKKFKTFNYEINNYYINNLKKFLLIKGDQKKINFYFTYNFLNLLKKNYNNFLKIILGCYPEINQNSINIFNDFKNIKIKNSIIKKSFFITQYFYNIDSFYYFLDNIKVFNNIKIIPSIMLIFCLKKIISFSNICKNEIPLWILNKLKNNFYNFKNFKKLNFEIFYNFLLKIINFKLNLIHFYTMNNLYFTNIICENTNNIINI